MEAVNFAQMVMECISESPLVSGLSPIELRRIVRCDVRRKGKAHDEEIRASKSRVNEIYQKHFVSKNT